MFTLTNLDSFQLRHIDFELNHGAEWVLLNPSIASDNEGFAVTVRSANFRVCPHGPVYWGAGGEYQAGVNELPDNRLFFLRLDEQLRIKNVHEIDIHTVRQDKPNCPFGFEDARLFKWNDNWWAMTNAPGPNFIDTCTIQLLELNDALQIKNVYPFASPYNRQKEKNWLPFINQNNLFFIYDWHPLSVFAVDEAHWKINLVSQIDLPDLREWHGSSQGLPTENGWLFVIHYRDVMKSRQRYLHKLIELDKEYKPVKISESFVFLHEGIEFCAGMTQKEDRIYFSFGGLHDDNAFICSIEIHELDDILYRYKAGD